MSSPKSKAWRCTVCGYVHQGAVPPEMCPICGSPKDAFESFHVQAKPIGKAKITGWRCLNCSYVHTGPQPPEACPVCGAPADCFEPLSEDRKKPAQVRKAGKIVIVGAGIAGLSAAETARAASGDAEITLISKETSLPYYRLNLTRYIAGEITEAQLPVKPQDWFKESFC